MPAKNYLSAKNRPKNGLGGGLFHKLCSITEKIKMYKESYILVYFPWQLLKFWRICVFFVIFYFFRDKNTMKTFKNQQRGESKIDYHPLKPPEISISQKFLANYPPSLSLKFSLTHFYSLLKYLIGVVNFFFLVYIFSLSYLIMLLLS